jgi:hypothetical protein
LAGWRDAPHTSSFQVLSYTYRRNGARLRKKCFEEFNQFADCEQCQSYAGYLTGDTSTMKLAFS